MEGLTAKKEKNFSEWFSQICSEKGAGLVDLRYGVQGFLVHRPWAFKILRNIYSLLEQEIELDNHEPLLFPTLIPEKNLKKEQEHAGFIPDVFWITEAGSQKIEEKLALRPTGETAIYPLYSLWIRSYNDLPFKAYQSRITVFRNEKTTRPFLRGKEFMFFETHDVFATHQESIKQIKKDLETMKSVIHNKLKIPFLFFKRPSWDRFKGAKDTYVADTIMPDGKRNQLSSTHDLSQNFSKAFKIKFKDKDKKEKFAYQTCFGPGIWRIMAALIAIHGDNKGLILPFEISPIHIIIIPITFSSKKQLSQKIVQKSKQIKNKLEKLNYKTKIDLEEESPGFKYNKWELLGVPLRLEIGPKELESKELTFVKRTDRKRIKISLTKTNIEKLKQEINKNIEKNAEIYFKNNTKTTNTFTELKNILEKHKGFVKVPFCSVEKDGEKCADILKAETNGGNVCGTLYPKKEKPKNNCIICNKKANHIVYIAKSY